MNILLTEADYPDKFPPLGLMKIATFHKLNGDRVFYSREYSEEKADYFSKIYISTRFSFHWNKTKLLIQYYQENFKSEIIVGGIHASLNPELYKKTFQIDPVVGGLRGEIEKIIPKIKKNKILNNILPEIEKFGIDLLPPDYSIFEGQSFPFNKILETNYLIRATKGCTRNCKFCGVKKICNIYIDKYPIKELVNYIAENFGEKKDILFFDDNTLLSNKFDLIISELKELGFIKNSQFKKKRRVCDFNQGLDLRLLDENKIQKISELCLNPLRLALDDVKDINLFKSLIPSILKFGFKDISIYVLYNFKDSPSDFYYRILTSIELNILYKSRLSSFPMKYIPNDTTSRNFVSTQWTKRKLRGLQCIMNGCHGIIPVKSEYFYNAFGSNPEEFELILQMPEKYIINRKTNHQKISEWKKDYSDLCGETRDKIVKFLSDKTIYKLPIIENIDVIGIKFLTHYLNEKY